VRDASRKSRWAAWSLCGALLVVGTLLVPCMRADAPADEPPAPSRAQVGSRPAQARPQRTQREPKAAKTPAKGVPKAAKKLPAREQNKKAARRPTRAVARTPKAAEAQGLDVATGPDDACHVQLRGAGVSFVKLKEERAPNVHLPIRLTGDVSGVEIQGAGKNKATHYLDCRLALALVRWAPQLKAAGVLRVDHYSIYRPDAQVSATRKPSAHALAMAIDAARFHLSDGRVLTVLDNWTDKSRGADPCTARPQQGADEQLLRELVCEASRRGIFQTVVTPHHNPEHNNHVHLEVSSSFAPTWIH
jgi:hypothetical protein